MLMLESPSLLVEEITSMPAMPAMRSSSTWVMRVSTTSALAPG